MILARNSITLHHLRDITTVVWYYKLQSSTASAPAKPTAATPSGWTTTEPTYTEGSTNSLYVCQKTTFSDGTFEYSDVSLSSSYEAAKAAYAKSVQAKETADAAQAAADELTPELIVGTHGTTATATWTGTSTVLSEIKAGTRIQYKLSSAGASNVTLNLTLKDGSTTGAKPVYYSNTTRLGTQYGVNAVVDLVYDGSAWRVLNPYTNSNTVGAYAGAVKAGANGVYNYSLVMRDTADTWVSLTTSAGTGTSKARYTGGLYPDKVLYMGSNAAYAEGATTGTCYDALALNLNYSTNSGSSLTVGKAVYLVGEIHSDGLFYLDSTWWTQTVPTTANGKTYIYLGLAYNTSNIYLSSENTAFVYYDGKFRTLREAEELNAAKSATNYISADSSGLMVANMADGTTYTPSTVPSGVKNAFVDNDSFDVRDGTDVLASFGTTSTIGKATEAHLEQTPTGSKVVSADGNDSVMMGAETSTPKSISETYSSDDAEITITLSPDTVEGCTITLTISGTSYTMTQGVAYRHIGSAYTIDYDGAYEIIVGNTLSSLLEISVTYTAMVASGYGVAVEALDDSARVRVKTNKTGGTKRSGMLATTVYGSLGLYDDDAQKWIIRSDENGQVYLPYMAIRPALLYNTKKTAPVDSSSYTYAKVSGLANYNVVVVRAEVRNVRQLLVFVRLFGNAPQNIIDYYTAENMYIRAQFLVDWTNNRIGVRWVNGNVTLASDIYFQQVYGIL